MYRTHDIRMNRIAGCGPGYAKIRNLNLALGRNHNILRLDIPIDNIIVMYEMVTGRVPFDGDTTVAISIQHLQAENLLPPRRRHLPHMLLPAACACLAPASAPACLDSFG